MGVSVFYGGIEVRHRLGRFAGVWAGALLIVACGGTDIGCGGDIYLLTAEAAKLAGADDFDIRVCVDGHCTGGAIAAAGAQPPNDTKAFESGRSDGGEAMIEIEATTADGVVHMAAGVVELDTYRPNGLLRAPRCAVANITIVDGEVRNAPPGLLPSVADRY
jgi:hypothetical protein